MTMAKIKPGIRACAGVFALLIAAGGCSEGALTGQDVDRPGEGEPEGGPEGGPEGNPEGEELPPFSPAPVTIHRLTADQYRQSVFDLTGVEVRTELEADTPIHGYASVGASELTLPPLAVEQYEAAAWEVADALVTDAGRRAAFVGCEPAQEGCMRSWLVRFGRLAWRRLMTGAEIAQIEAAAQRVGQEVGDPWQGVATAIAILLQSPHFLFRVEFGEVDPEGSGLLRYTSYEMASRLSFFLWGTTPDDALLQAAERGELQREEGLRGQAERMLNDPRGQARMGAFFAEYMGLSKLGTVSKDAERFPEFDEGLRASMRRELELLFDAIVFEGDEDFRTLLTTRTTFVDGPLAEIYGLEGVAGDQVARAELPEAADRGGLVGRAAISAIYAHATVNSPTLRGRFVRERLLCQDIPPPPEGVVTSLGEDDPEAGPQTLRQRLDVHRRDPACVGCHSLVDPIGFTLEHFDPIGRWRELDNGLPIDATGFLDAAQADGAAELGQAIAESPRFTACVARQLYRNAAGHLEIEGELSTLAALAAGFEADGFRFKALAVRIVLSDGFRRAAPPLGEPCEAEEEGSDRMCGSACGQSTERCEGGFWSGCDAPAPEQEACNGVDDDCDGQIDEDVVRACDEGVGCGQGSQRCEGGAWGACERPAPPAESCNGVDDDCDGQTDEGIAVELVRVSFGVLAGHHDGCEGARQRRGPQCNAAIHRMCAARACSATGFGPVLTQGDQATAACVSGDRVQTRSTTYTALAGQHDVCNGSRERFGPNCNAAIHRWCASQGLTSGFGPLENSGDDAQVGCTPGAEVIVTSYGALSGFNAACQAGGERIGPSCDAAIHSYCLDRGFVAGFGPVENSGDTAVVTCIRPQE